MTAPIDSLSAPRTPERASAATVRQVVLDHAGYVSRTLRYLGVPDSDVDDATQEVFVVVYRRLGSFEGRSSLRTWLYGVCMRVASARRRGMSRRREAPVSEPPDQPMDPAQEEHLQRQEARRRLLAALDQLDGDKREVFVLYEIEQRPMKEVAEALGCPVQTAYYRLHAARERVVRIFEAWKEQQP